jgi:uncharacterized BrkB/YihY/UPF0761 family membrane protein
VPVLAVNFIVSLGMLTLPFAMFFHWFPVLCHGKTPGAARLATAVPFNFGKMAIAWDIGRRGRGSTYGAAASVAILLTWVYSRRSCCRRRGHARLCAAKNSAKAADFIISHAC